MSGIENDQSKFLDRLLNAKFSRKEALLVASGAALAAAGCTPKNPNTQTSAVPGDSESASASASASASETEKSPYETYYSLIPAELKTRIEALKAKTSAERQQLSWGDQTLYAVAWALERELNGQYNDGFISTKTGITNGDTLQNHAMIRTPLSLESKAQDIWEQNCYFVALIPSMLTRDTERDLVPLVATENSPFYDYYANNVIKNSEPGNWGAGQEAPTWRATQGDVYATEDNGKQVKRRDLTVTNPSNGKHLIEVFEFTAMPLLEYAAATKGITTNGQELGIWVSVSNHS